MRHQALSCGHIRHGPVCDWDVTVREYFYRDRPGHERIVVRTDCSEEARVIALGVAKGAPHNFEEPVVSAVRKATE